MGNHPVSRTSPTERALLERSIRYETPLPQLLVWIAGTAVQLPNEIAVDLVRRRMATAIADPTIRPTIILGENDIDDDLEQLLVEAAA